MTADVAPGSLLAAFLKLSLFVGGTLSLMSQSRNESRPFFNSVHSDIVFMRRPNLSQAEQLAQRHAQTLFVDSRQSFEIVPGA